MNERECREIIAAVGAAMQSFEAAERALDAERLLSHIARVPEFHVHHDGRRLDYDAMAADVRSGFASLHAIDGGFHDIQVIVLARDAALATAAFGEVITDANGDVTRLHGAATWLWRCLDDEWRIVYGHVDHYPDE